MNKCIHRRIRKELETLNKDPPNFCSVCPSEDDLLKWTGIFFGPYESAYGGGTFYFDITFPITYPFKPPEIHFETKIFHPSIDSSGNVCLNSLTQRWAPNLSIGDVLLSIRSMLEDPSLNEPLNENAATLFINDKKEFEKIARQWTYQYAS